MVHLRNGENFRGSSHAFFETRILRFDMVQGATVTPVKGRMGDVPALSQRVDQAGLMVIVHQTRPSTLKYKKWGKFQKFADHKDFPDIRTRHLARGLPEHDFTERYHRYAKALVAIGAPDGADAPTGLETEFIALSNPYAPDYAGVMEVELRYRDQIRADAQIEIFEKSPSGDVTVTLMRSDALGRAAIATKPGYSYLLDAVVLRPLPEGNSEVWETLWAALSFGVPEPR